MSEQKVIAANPAFITFTVNVNNTPTFSSLLQHAANLYRLELIAYYAELRDISSMPDITITSDHQKAKPEFESTAIVSNDGKCKHPNMKKFAQFNHCPDCHLS